MEMAQESKPEGTKRSRRTPSQYLTFRLAEETYAVGILQAREILRYEELTKVPSTPESIRGVLNLRGSVVPVVDLAVKFGLPKSTITKWTCIVIVETTLDGEDTVMGILADSVNEVLDLTEDDIEPPPPFGTKVHIEYLVGMGRTEKRFILILDIDKVLSKVDTVAVDENVDENGATEPDPPDGKPDKFLDLAEDIESKSQTEHIEREKQKTKPYATATSEKSDNESEASSLSNQVVDTPQDRSEKSPKSTETHPGKQAKTCSKNEKNEKTTKSSTTENTGVEINETKGDLKKENVEEKRSTPVEIGKVKLKFKQDKNE